MRYLFPPNNYFSVAFLVLDCSTTAALSLIGKDDDAQQLLERKTFICFWELGERSRCQKAALIIAVVMVCVCSAQGVALLGGVALLE